MCQEIERSNDTFSNIDITKYFQEMNTLNKDGFTLRNTKTSKERKIFGACISSLIFSLFFIFLILMISYFQLTEENKIPWIVYIILVIIIGSPILGIVINLINRIKEIKGGEEDEASKY